METASRTDLESLERLFQSLPADKQKELFSDKALQAKMAQPWLPFPGPQTEAYYTEADVTLYGGRAGGGKTGLIIGLALTQHRRSLILRRQYSDLNGIIEDMLEKYGTRDGFNGSPPAKLRTKDGRLIEFGGVKLPGDEEHWKGQAHDLLAIDEASQFLESQVRFLMGWVRTTVKGQKCRTVLATNPPHSEAEGQWLKNMFAPWLNPSHPMYRQGAHPQYGRMPGELLWVITNEEGKDEWVDGPDPVSINGRTYTPTSRTFFPAGAKDNPALGDEYEANLDALQEPLRSAVRDGNWMIAVSDDESQVIPTQWVLAAQSRWETSGYTELQMTALALDSSGEGEDPAVVSSRYGGWFAPLEIVRGVADENNMTNAILKVRRDGCPIVLDSTGGYSAGVIAVLKANEIPYLRFNFAEGSPALAKETGIGFHNRRAEAWWRFREALDPGQEGGSAIALPPDDQLRAELTAPTFEITTRGYKIEGKEDIKKRLGRSTDRADAVIMCLSEGNTAVRQKHNRAGGAPKVILGHQERKRHYR